MYNQRELVPGQPDRRYTKVSVQTPETGGAAAAAAGQKTQRGDRRLSPLQRSESGETGLDTVKMS